MTTQFTDDEIETIKSLISEWGSDCPDTDSDKVQELRYKLGLSIRPTTEEIAAREKRYDEIRNSPYGKQMAEIMSASNQYLEKMAEDILGPNVLFDKTDFKIGSTLRIKMPTDYDKKD